jgi:glycosyltransferase involved in cell wall biosynthesis
MVSAADKIPVTVIVATRNEAARIEKCLRPLQDFAEIIVVDSGSRDRTKEIAAGFAKVVDFAWDGRYPKKRQWCLESLQLLHDWVFFVDADEIVTPALVEEIRNLDFRKAGYFVRGLYVVDGVPLKFGLTNNKLALMDGRKMEFPVVDDLGLPGMGEIEGHYQPVLKKEYSHEKIGQLKHGLLHDACDDEGAWLARHERYAVWEREMNRRKAWPGDVKRSRVLAKIIFRAMPFRPAVAFLHCYVVKLGFLDGRRGFRFARSRYRYYKMI